MEFDPPCIIFIYGGKCFDVVFHVRRYFRELGLPIAKHIIRKIVDGENSLRRFLNFFIQLNFSASLFDTFGSSLALLLLLYVNKVDPKLRKIMA